MSEHAARGIEHAGIVPVVLAGGSSVRMGYPKALLPLGNRTFLGVILDTLNEAGLPPPVVVLGKDAPRILPLLEGRPAAVLVNPSPEKGQISSLRLALGALPQSAAGCLVWPVDQPAVPARLVSSLVNRCLETDAPLGMPVCGGRRGHPVYFSRDLFGELLGIAENEGARAVVLRHLDEAVLAPADDTAVIQDVDTPEDFRRLTGIPLEEALRGSQHRPAGGRHHPEPLSGR